MASHLRFDSDNEVTDSEDENEKELLNSVRRRYDNDDDFEDNQAVYDVHSESNDDEDDDDDFADIADSDIEDKDDDLPDQYAWGKDKSKFFGTDYVDQDYGTYEGHDAEQADQEEDEAKLLQKKLLEQFSKDDFSLNAINKITVQTDKTDGKDATKISKSERESGLIKGTQKLIEDLKKKLEVAQNLLMPIIELAKKDEIIKCNALDFVNVYCEAILKFQVNISAYLVLQNSKINLASHPIIKRLYQWQQLFIKMDPIYENKIKAQLIKLLEISKTKKTLKVSAEPPRKRIKLDKASKKSVNFNTNVQVKEIENSEYDETNHDEEDKNYDAEEMNEDSRRAINYQISKNKGLTPHRNKMNRNPRVKYRNKFREAKKRRRGAVREVRKETTRYAGELSGIKITSSKSIKIK